MTVRGRSGYEAGTRAPERRALFDITQRLGALEDGVTTRELHIGRARLFTRDDGTGLTQLCVQIGTGPTQILATETQGE